ncbi:E3 ubiquitin-protein ligase ARIH2-like [Megalobrama amblycephala]|uniref:E3 ubiquitin-protein ligase ARIH2-like n=1 Tax=Megalobrama amblycephala TaxID=75352 RepID=UPI002014104E|nr:E3 ubiquitin-protein ligase ARIH2-like [Megalobrama amblycephala]XP_048044069.1 E3 ubiquitin-protein ligase ARIH2-like [Megalobrama amblycephala]XP_048044070.1 E3 ubiquitin-protein ligase ARIH2-like [Megalobrama amblycephala]
MNAPKCPICHQSDIGILDGQCAVCKSCSKSNRCVFQFCLACERKWPQDISTTKSCMLPNCALRAALLSDTRINDPESSVRGCPYFRACPGCHALLTHSGEGCPNIICPKCNQEFCFRCLRPECYDNEDYADDEYYDDYDQDDPEPELCVIVDNNEILQHLGL